MPSAAERTAAAPLVALARSQPLDPGHQACTPCMGRVMLKAKFDHTYERSTAALENCTRPVGMDNQVGTSTCF